MEKAYDLINREKLWYKLQRMNISNKFIKILIRIYEDIEFCVRVDENDNNSEFIKQERGLRQGCNLSPILFNIFVNDILDSELMKETHSPVVNNEEIHGLQFADDLIVVSLTPIGLQRKIDLISKYCNKWELRINAEKSKILVVRNGTKHSKREDWYLEGKKLEVVDSIKYLGVNINSRCIWREYNNDKMKHGIGQLNRLRRICSAHRGCDFRMANNIFRALVESKIMYSMVIWGEENVGVIIDKIRARFGKVWLKLPYNTANSVVSKELGMKSGKGTLLTRIIKYYCYIVVKENDEVVKTCMNYYVQKMRVRGKLNTNFRIDRVVSMLEKKD